MKAPAAHPMFNEVLRWQRRPDFAYPYGRWIAWARSLAERGARSETAGAAAGQTLPPWFRPSVPVWNRPAVTLQLHWDLRFAPRRGATLVVYRQHRGEGTRVGAPRFIVPGVGVSSVPPVREAGSPTHGHPALAFAPRSMSLDEPTFHMAASTYAAGRLMQPLACRATAGLEYLSRTAAPVPMALPTTRVLVDRIAQQGRRIEERPPAAVTSRHQDTVEELPRFRPTIAGRPRPAALADAVFPPAPMTHAATTTRAEGRERPAAKAAPPTIDVESLTDQVVRQIDQRIIALRERMGKAF